MSAQPHAFPQFLTSSYTVTGDTRDSLTISGRPSPFIGTGIGHGLSVGSSITIETDITIGSGVSSGIGPADYQNPLFFISHATNEPGFQTASAPSTPTITSSENEINSRRKAAFIERFIPRLKALIREEPFEPGVLSRADELVETMLESNSMAAKDCLQEVFLNSIETADYDIACGIVEIVGRCDESKIDPQGRIMALAALAVKSSKLQEAGVRAFENWASESSAKTLERIEYTSSWVRDYAFNVVSAIRSVRWAS